MSDPHYLREAEKYESPIPSREHILSFIQKRPKSKRQLFELLSIEDEQKKAFERRLRAMVRDKQLSCNKSGVYRPSLIEAFYLELLLPILKVLVLSPLRKGAKI